MLLAVFQHQTEDGCSWLLALDKGRFTSVPLHLQHVDWTAAELSTLDEISRQHRELVRQDVEGQGYALVRTSDGFQITTEPSRKSLEPEQS